MKTVGIRSRIMTSTKFTSFQVMLVSDPTTDKSAGALDVHIGYMVDDQDLPGLAHFCEHMRKCAYICLCSLWKLKDIFIFFI